MWAVRCWLHHCCMRPSSSHHRPWSERWWSRSGSAWALAFIQLPGPPSSHRSRHCVARDSLSQPTRLGSGGQGSRATLRAWPRTRCEITDHAAVDGPPRRAGDHPVPGDRADRVWVRQLVPVQGASCAGHVSAGAGLPFLPGRSRPARQAHGYEFALLRCHAGFRPGQGRSSRLPLASVPQCPSCVPLLPGRPRPARQARGCEFALPRCRAEFCPGQGRSSRLPLASAKARR